MQRSRPRRILNIVTSVCMYIYSLSKDYYYYYYYCFAFCRAAPAAYGSSENRGWIWATAAGLYHSHSHARSKPHLQPTSQLMTTPDNLTHWVGPGIEHVSSWLLVGFFSAEPQQELPCSKDSNLKNQNNLFLRDH